MFWSIINESFIHSYLLLIFNQCLGNLRKSTQNYERTLGRENLRTREPEPMMAECESRSLTTTLISLPFESTNSLFGHCYHRDDCSLNN